MVVIGLDSGSTGSGFYSCVLEQDKEISGDLLVDAAMLVDELHLF